MWWDGRNRFYNADGSGMKKRNVYVDNVVALRSLVGIFSKIAKKRALDMSCVAVRPPHGTARPPLDVCSLTVITEYFWKICRENSSMIGT
jgi:hypothetical protein